MACEVAESKLSHAAPATLPALAELNSSIGVGTGAWLGHDTETEKRQPQMVQDALPSCGMHISESEWKAYLNGERVKLKNGLVIWKRNQNSSECHQHPDHYQPETKS